MGAMADLVVVALATYPRAREAAVAHEVVDVGLDGLAGDRPKKAAVSLVGRSCSPSSAPATAAEACMPRLVTRASCASVTW